MPLPLSPSREFVSEPGRPAPGGRLALCLAAIAAIWLLILPALAEVSSIQRMIDRHEADGVDPSAKFYSELPAMPMISQRVDEIRRAQPEAFGLDASQRRHSERSEESGGSHETPDPSLRSG
jgi:hypothetical protein